MSETTRNPGKGYWGRVLHVDLSNGTHDFEDFDEEFYRKYLGGIGLGARVLWERLRPGCDPMGPENILGFTTGLLTDTGALFMGRFNLVGKSPSTGGWGDANGGGYFAPALKRCGVDAVFFHGRSPHPVYLHMDDQTVEIKDASDLWGKDTSMTETLLRDRHGKRAQVACIGPGGERLSYMAGVCNDGGRIAARSGLGAVMGSKLLKAVVAAGKKKIGVDDRDRIKTLSKKFRKRLQEKAGLKKIMGDRVFGLVGWLTRKGPLYTRQPADLFRLMMSKYGTSSMTAMSAESGDSPVKNWGGVGYLDFPLERSQKIGAGALARYQIKRYGCFSCPLRCGAILKVEDGPYPVEEMHRPEYETLCAFGTLLLNDDLHSIFKINDLLNRAGLDSISCGGTVAFAIECFENGLLHGQDIEGLELRWGNSKAIIRLVEMIISRQGIGDILADGVKIAARKLGPEAEAFAVHCGGMEPPMHDPKFDPGFGTAYLCEPAPSRHMVSSYMLLDLLRLDRHFNRAGKPPAFMTSRERLRFENKGEAMALGSFFRMLVDCAGGCVFGVQVGGDMPLLQWFNAATGWDFSDEDYLTLGERVEQLRHAFNVREGLNPVRDFRPHARITGSPPLDKGPARGVSLPPDAMAQPFYDALGWDMETGMPDPKRMESLGLDDVMETLTKKPFSRDGDDSKT
ncbi:MAG: aldehyde ferredoxin oxidoreductase family protein [Deltaproteobacteria bacterium]|nr:aldehyde ferredoxin oxidoreductase family protein [Deltaproteobacteria bacterium]